MGESWTPSLCLREEGGRCRLWLGGFAYGDGQTLQEAADDLVARLLNIAVCIRQSGLKFSSELAPPDPRWLEFVWELGELAARGKDIRERVFGWPDRPGAETGADGGA
jgi:hypothetical protein